jgi:hypothetical protein
MAFRLSTRSRGVALVMTLLAVVVSPPVRAAKLVKLKQKKKKQ